LIILTLNCGSSSAKYQVYDWDNKEVLCSGVVERVTFSGSFIKHSPKGKDEFKKEHDCPTHTEAIRLIIETILDPVHGVIRDVKMIKAVGHRVLHGGDRFTKSVVIDSRALDTFKEVQDLGPLHNPANIMGIEAARSVLPDVPHCAIMDTAWHQTMPKHTYLYAL
jgi:acetate kinase